MKKLILSLALLATMAVSQAQDQTKKKSFGIKSGLNYSTATVKREFENSVSPRTSFYLGVYGNFKISNKVAFQPELVYSAQGYSEKYTFLTSINRDTDVRLNYINVPFLFQYQIMDKMYVETGPQIGFVLSAKMDDAYFDSATNTTEEFINNDVKGETNSSIFSYSFGVGYDISSKLRANARYNLGITQIDKLYEISVINNLLQVGLEYKF